MSFSGWVGIHHSLEWLLVELFKHMGILTEENLRMVGLGGMRNICLRSTSEQAILAINEVAEKISNCL